MTIPALPGPRGRGASSNPANRFEPLQIDLCDDTDPADAGSLLAPATRLYKDTAKSAIARNDSPDIPFETSINPYRGCEHGCVYCLAPDTPILYADGMWRPLGEVRVGDELLAFDEHEPLRGPRSYRLATVQNVWRYRKPTLRVRTAGGVVSATAEHLWLTPGGRWVRTDQLEAGGRLLRQPKDRAGCTRVQGITPNRRDNGGIALLEPAALRTAEPVALIEDPVLSIEPGPVTDVIDIQTSTRTFFAAGLATHNCYARPFHEYLGFSAGLDFESRILVKENVAQLLRKELLRPSWKPQVIAVSGVTDAYQPVERKLKLTRACLEVLAEFRNPVSIITKSDLVTRDIDVLSELHRYRAARVDISITTLDADLARAMEPRAATPLKRLEAIRRLAHAGIPVGVMVAPILPGLTESEIPAIVQAAREAGATRAGHIVLRLPHGLGELFEEWLEEHVPDRRQKVMNRVRHLRGGKTNDARHGSRMTGEGIFAREIQAMFDLACRRSGMPDRREPLSVDSFRRPVARQLGLFPA